MTTVVLNLFTIPSEKMGHPFRDGPLLTCQLSGWLNRENVQLITRLISTRRSIRLLRIRTKVSREACITASRSTIKIVHRRFAFKGVNSKNVFKFLHRLGTPSKRLTVLANG